MRFVIRRRSHHMLFKMSSSGFLFTFVLQNKKGSSFLCVKRENNDVIQSLAILSLSLSFHKRKSAFSPMTLNSLFKSDLFKSPILLCKYLFLNVTRFDYFLSIKRNICCKVRPFMAFPPNRCLAFIRLCFTCLPS